MDDSTPELHCNYSSKFALNFKINQFCNLHYVIGNVVDEIPAMPLQKFLGQTGCVCVSRPCCQRVQKYPAQDNFVIPLRIKKIALGVCPK